MNIAVVGTGYVGLVSGTCFAETGNHVICVDIDANKVAQMKRGEIPIYEPGLEVLFERNIENNRISFTTDLKSAVQASEMVFLALPTPPGEDGAADLRYVLQVAQDLTEIIEKYTVVVNKSTVPVGTAQKVHDVLAAGLSTDLFDVASNPEFLREGVAVDDFMKPDRIVVGTRSDRVVEKMNRLYAPYVRQGNPVLFMDERSAEMTKYAANSYLAARISFMNEIANLSEKLGADVDKVRAGMGSDTRIGKRFLFPGVGFGGSCFPKDVNALVMMANQNDYDFKILNSVLEVNALQKRRLVQKMKAHFGALSGKRIAIWGLAFKPNTDDIREAPALEIIDELLETGARVVAYDPEAMDNVRDLIGDKIDYADDVYTAVQDADALAIVTEWGSFRNPDFEKIKSTMKTPVIFDGRNLYDLDRMRELGFSYMSIGREDV